MYTSNIKPILPEKKSKLYELVATGETREKRTIALTKADLLKPLPSDYLSQKPVFSKGTKSNSVNYIPWKICLLILDYLCPHYHYEVSESQLNNLCVVKGKLTIFCTDGELIAEALGSDNLDDVAYGGAIADSSAQALRRCFATLGGGRFLSNGQTQSTPTGKNQSRQYSRRNETKPTYSTKNNTNNIPVWKNWKSESDAILWGRNQLPDKPVQELMQKFKSLTGEKKAVDWINWVNQVKKEA